MKKIVTTALSALFAIACTNAKEVGKPAPAFTGKTLAGEEVSLSDFKGKVVVLEWINFDCPFVKKHYSASGNMGKLQEKYQAQDVVWLTICSSAEGKQGWAEPSAQAERAKKEGNKATHFIADTDGTIGKAYDAKVTPHMFVICREGNLVYNGAIDSIRSTNADDVEKAEPWLANAIDAVLAGEEVQNATNAPYGCGVKY
ncbi:MAG: redoxin family protein [Luteolibacter sp.]|jgi:alkyl hydroperoxide reductase subunit AhpC